MARQQLPSRHFLYHNPRPDYEFGPSLSLIFPQMPQATPVSRAQESHPDCRLPEVTGTDCSPPCGHTGLPNNHGTRILQKQQPQKHKNADQQSMTDGDPGGVVLLRCCEGPTRCQDGTFTAVTSSGLQHPDGLHNQTSKNAIFTPARHFCPGPGGIQTLTGGECFPVQVVYLISLYTQVKGSFCVCALPQPASKRIRTLAHVFFS